MKTEVRERSQDEGHEDGGEEELDLERELDVLLLAHNVPTPAHPRHSPIPTPDLRTRAAISRPVLLSLETPTSQQAEQRDTTRVEGGGGGGAQVSGDEADDEADDDAAGRDEEREHERRPPGLLDRDAARADEHRRARRLSERPEQVRPHA
eukprot:1332159-Rhodomonas_salina.2